MTTSLPEVRILLVDDDPLVCRGLEFLLETAPELAVVGMVHDGDQVLDGIARHRPDVVLMDVRMGRQDGVTTTAQVVRLPQAPKVLILTTYDHDDVLLRAIEAGAAGFLLKTASPQDIIASVRDVAGGEGALSARSARQIFEYVHQDPRRQGSQFAQTLVETLTPREFDVARAVARGWTNARIAKELYLGEATVKTHLSAAQLKLGANSRVQVAILIDRAGALDPAAFT